VSGNLQRHNRASTNHALGDGKVHVVNARLTILPSEANVGQAAVQHLQKCQQATLVAVPDKKAIVNAALIQLRPVIWASSLDDCLEACININTVVWRGNRGIHDGTLDLLMKTVTKLTVPVPMLHHKTQQKFLSYCLGNLGHGPPGLKPAQH
jgi:hypothetical protein